jgi:hypothetical protein
MILRTLSQIKPAPPILSLVRSTRFLAKTVLSRGRGVVAGALREAHGLLPGTPRESGRASSATPSPGFTTHWPSGQGKGRAQSLGEPPTTRDGARPSGPSRTSPLGPP